MRIEELRREAAKFLRIGLHVLAQWRYNRKKPEYRRTGRKSNRKAIETYLWSTTLTRGL
jgi:hypothetical protein